MNINKSNILALLMLAGTGIATTAHANEVTVKINKPTQVTYRIAHQNTGQSVQLGEFKTIQVHEWEKTDNGYQIVIPVNLDGYDYAGVMTVAIAGHKLPLSVNQFNKPKQCSMTTNNQTTSGTLKLSIENHKASCGTEGGIFE